MNNQRPLFTAKYLIEKRIIKETNEIIWYLQTNIKPLYNILRIIQIKASAIDN